MLINLINTNPQYVKNYVVKQSNPLLKESAKVLTTTQSVDLNKNARNISFCGKQFYPLKYIDKYVNKKVIENALQVNPNITELLSEYGIEPKISEKNIGTDAKKHMFATYLYAKDMAKSIGLDKASTKTLLKASLVHDIGKALIPEEIIQKPGALTPKEREIINLHSRLGYEILKTTDIEEDVSKAILLHHTPEKDKNNIVAQILSVADVYSALSEKRVYKPAIDDITIFGIMELMHFLSQEYVQILHICRLDKKK